MYADRHFKSINFKQVLQLLGKPVYYILLIILSSVYFAVLIVKALFNKTKHGRFIAQIARVKKLPIILISVGASWFQSIIYRSKNTLTFLSNTPRYFFSKIHRKLKTSSPKAIALNNPVIVTFIKLPSKISLPHIHISIPKLSLLIFLSAAIYYSHQLVFAGLPHPKQLLSYKSPVTTKVFDRNQQPLYQIYQDEDRSIISLDQVPNHVILATLAIEDSNFFDHPGFSIKGIARALKANLTQDSLQGGSTITQQLIKNTLLTPERTIIRKLKEIVLAVAVESYFTKNEILTMYLNQVGYGGTAYGIEAASRMYFNKSVQDLSLAESALIAGLPASPTTYSPFGANPELATFRQKEVLRRMVEEGYISTSQAESALETKLQFASPTSDIKAPHFVMYVRDYLVDVYGEDLVNQGGLHVTTTIDLEIQEMAEKIVQQEVANLERLNIHNAAAIITNPKTGEVLAMVGSKNYFDTENDGQVNVTLRPRQPGSSIKPVNYAYALENGYTPNTIINDSPVVYQIAGSPPYAPKNYDGRFHGRVTLRQALANSYNVPAVKTLNHFGVPNMISLGQNMGITTWNNPSRFGLALTLGGGEVTLADMAVVYGTFANLGLNVPLNPLLSITDYTLKNYSIPSCPIDDSQLTLAKQVHALDSLSECQPEQVISPATAFLMSDILSDNQARSQAFGTNSVLNIPGHQVAVKTGTTNNMRDNWTIGYTSDYVVGVWVGNNDNTPMSYVASGITGASPIWSKIMTALIQDQALSHSFPHPEEVIKVTVCPATNTLTCKQCPNPKTEFFIRGTEPKTTCSPNNFQDTNSNQRDQILTGITTN